MLGIHMPIRSSNVASPSMSVNSSLGPRATGSVTYSVLQPGNTPEPLSSTTTRS
jgi:hypothetical protein